MNEDEIQEMIQSAVSEALEGRDDSPATDQGGVDSKLNQLRREKAEAVDRMKELRDKMVEGEDLSEEEQDEFDELEERAERLAEKIDRLESSQKFEVRDKDIEISPNTAPRDSTEYRDVYAKWLKHGKDGLKSHERDTLLEHRAEDMEEKIEERALGTEQGGSGGYLVPDDFMEELTVALQENGAMRRAPTDQFSTDHDRTMPVPQFDDTSNSGQYIKEGGSFGRTDPDTSKAQLDAYVCTSDELEVKIQLLRSSGISDLEDRIFSALGERIADASNTAFTTGSGSNEPEGVLTASVQATTSDATGSMDYDDLNRLKNSINPAIKRKFDLRWMFNQSTKGEIERIKDGNSRPIFIDGQADREPQVMGYPFTVNQDMPDVSGGNDAVLFGAFRRYVIRDVNDVALVRIPVEAKMAADQNRQVGFVAFQSNDGVLNNPGDDPIQHLTISS